MKKARTAILVMGLAAVMLCAQTGIVKEPPVAGKNWVRGGNEIIKWSCNGYSGQVRLVLMRNGAKVGRIHKGVPAASGQYPWKVGQHEGGLAPVGKGYSIRLNLLSAKKIVDGKPFEIIQATGTPGFPPQQNPSIVTNQLDPKYRPKRTTLGDLPPTQVKDPEIVYFRAIPDTVEPGDKVRLEYHFKEGTTTAVIKIQTSPGIFDKVVDLPKGTDRTGSYTVEPKSEKSNYVLEVGNDAKSLSEFVWVTSRYRLKIYKFNMWHSQFPQQPVIFYYHFKGAEEAFIQAYNKDKGKWEDRVNLQPANTGEINDSIKLNWDFKMVPARARLIIRSKYGFEFSQEVPPFMP